MGLRLDGKVEALLKRGKFTIEWETDQRLYISLNYNLKKWDITYDKTKDKWSCTCLWSSIKVGGPPCSHILAAQKRYYGGGKDGR